MKPYIYRVTTTTTNNKFILEISGRGTQGRTVNYNRLI